MLYDVLIIDDDFGAPPLESAKNNNTHIQEVQKFVLSLVRKNLRVTWSTGERKDLEKLSAAELSTIRYIFLDLHLTKEAGELSYEIINSTLVSIISFFDKNIKQEQVTCYINSKHIKDKTYGLEGRKDLKNALNKEFNQKYCLDINEFTQKNTLTDKQEKILHEYSLDIYARSMVMHKFMEIEAVFDEKLRIDPKLRDVIIFENKYKKFRERFVLNKKINNKIKLLQSIRNSLAHNGGNVNIALQKISNKEQKKVFWNIQNPTNFTATSTKNSTPDNIAFRDFRALTAYLCSIDTLKDELENAEKKKEEKDDAKPKDAQNR